MSYARASKNPLVPATLVCAPQDLFRYVTVDAGAGAAWPANNRAIYIPFSFPGDATVTGVKFICTANNAAGRNFDAGFYNIAGTKLSSSGATLVAAGINTWASSQYIEGGTNYYFGLSLTSASTLPSIRAWASAAIVSLRANGLAQEASAHPLPATFTLAQTASAYLPTVVFTIA